MENKGIDYYKEVLAGWRKIYPLVEAQEMKEYLKKRAEEVKKHIENLTGEATPEEAEEIFNES